MGIRNVAGMPAVGYVQLTNATPAAAISIYVIQGSGTPYALSAKERFCLTGFVLSSNDTAVPLVQITDQATTPKILASAYVGSTQPPAVASPPPGVVFGALGLNLKAVAAAVTSAKTVEVNIYGYVFIS